GVTVPVSALRRVSQYLIDIHGQHESQSLLRPGTHVSFLDLFAGREITGLINEYRERLSDYKAVSAEIEEINGDPKKRAASIDLLSFQVNEIESARLKPGEENDLIAKQKIIDNYDKINEAVQAAYQNIDGGSSGRGARSLLDVAAESLSRISRYTDDYADTVSKIKEAYYTLEDVADFLRSRAFDETDYRRDAARIEERLDLIYRLKGKYGDSEEEILAFLDNARLELSKLENSAGRAEQLRKRLKDIREQLENQAEMIYRKRQAAAGLLKQNIMGALADLDMAKMCFDIAINHDASEFKANGCDTVEFIISTNPGEELKPLSKIASGGELARIMLAIKSCLAEVDKIPVMIFDEIDTGISGAQATSVAEKFAELSANHQVICVTHLAQIAAISSHNICVTKEYPGNSAETRVQVLDEEGKVREISRLLDGGEDAGEALRAHSLDLIARMQKRVQQ
ncbi:MAG: DNA repair protein RecN, partial [Bacteroidales bacterium]|nr:DNA repair protein RecN [Bacteroidales bacterium]